MALAFPKNAASLILLKPILMSQQEKKINHDYQVLMLQRKQEMSFGNTFVFPGGHQDQQDKVFSDNQESLKMTALRETYEESGILFGSRLEIDKLQLLLHQSQISEKSSFNQLINTLKVDINSIENFFHIITPQIPHIKRYNTQFFISQLNNGQQLALNLGQYLKINENFDQLQQFDKLNFNEQESTTYIWESPNELLGMYYQQKIQLAPPILLLLMILSSFKQAKEIFEYLEELKQQSNIFKEENKLFLNPTIFPFIFCIKQEKNPNSNIISQILLPGDFEFNYERIIANEHQVLSDYLRENYEALSKNNSKKLRFQQLKYKSINKKFHLQFDALINDYVGKKIFFERLEHLEQQKKKLISKL